VVATAPTEALVMLQTWVEIGKGSAMVEVGSPTRKTSGEVSPLVEVSCEDLA
jgi:hypothetical protein